MGRKVLKICCNEWKNESRDKRELSVYRELGENVCVLAKGAESDRGREENVDGFQVYRYSSSPIKNLPRPVNRIASLFVWAQFVRKIKPDVISGHDLPGLTVGWISTWFSRKKPLLIYDSHEYELGRNAKRSLFAQTFIKYYERLLLKRSSFSIVVNDSIADEVKRVHKLRKRPIVVRSTPELWNINEQVCKEKREEFVKSFGEVGIQNPYLLMYHGALTTSRGIEQLLMAVKDIPNSVAVILGDGEKSYMQELESLVEQYQVSKRVLFHPAVPYQELRNYVGAVDISVMVIQANAKSYYYALPNKFFESIQALTPIIASNFPEMDRIVGRYGIGITCKADSQKEINDSIMRLCEDKALFQRCRENLRIAKADLCWENEKKVLINAYREYIGT